MSDQLTELSILDAGRLLRSRELTVESLVRAYLDRISRVDGSLHSFVAVLADDAVANAVQLDNELASGRDRGPLHGIPIAVKDIFETRNVPTTMGSKLFAEYVAKEDAPTITALYDAGAVLLGKLNMDEFALGATGTNSLFPRCVNPLDFERISGGSSSGSGCATAASLCAASLGTDTAGSIRVPAALCGVVGIKPTYGRVSKRGVLPLSWSLDHVGSVGRSVQDAWLVLCAISFPDIDDPHSALDQPALDSTELVFDRALGLADLKIGVALDGIFSGAEPEICRAIARAGEIFASLGAEVRDVTIDGEIPGGIISTEASVLYETQLAESPHLFGDRVRAMLTKARERPVRNYANGRRNQDILTRQFDRALGDLDMIIAPTTPIAAPKFNEVDDANISGFLTKFTGPINFTGLPALTIPCGKTSESLPIGMQLVGRRWEERLICTAGLAFELEFAGQRD